MTNAAMNETKALAPRKRQQTLKDLLEKAKPALSQVLPRHLTAERVVKIALAATSRTPLLLQCTPQSILQAVMQASQLGLEPGSVLGSAYLVPFKNKNGTMECTLIPGYRGLIDLARRSGQIQSIEARVVYANDDFDYAFGLDVVLRHKPALDAEPGEIVAVYGVAHLKDGGVQVEVMRRAEVDAIRKRSRASGSGPWVTDYAEMARKTVIRRLCKYLPLSVELAAALELDAQASGEAEVGAIPDLAVLGTSGEIIDVEDAVVAEETKPSATEQLRGKVSAIAGATEKPPAAAEREPGADDEG